MRSWTWQAAAFLIVLMQGVAAQTGNSQTAMNGAQSLGTTIPIDKNHSSIAFHVPILNKMSIVHGKFMDFDIQLSFDEADVTRSSVKATIAAASVDTGIAARDQDLRGPSFFDVEKYPNIIFESSRVERQGDHFVAIGTLSMHGVARPLEMPFRITGTQVIAKTGKKVSGFLAALTLNRRDYGINWTHSVDPNFVGDNIDVELEVLTRAH